MLILYPRRYMKPRICTLPSPSINGQTPRTRSCNGGLSNQVYRLCDSVPWVHVWQMLSCVAKAVSPGPLTRTAL
jgi:hypothetical protein